MEHGHPDLHLGGLLRHKNLKYVNAKFNQSYKSY